MGWWGFGQEGGNVVASVGDQVVPLDEYRRAYENTYRFYKDKGQNDIKDEFLKQFVLEQLIDNRMWLHVAKETVARAWIQRDDRARARPGSAAPCRCDPAATRRREIRRRR